MLVLTRKVNEEILIGDQIRIKVVDISPGRIRLGISAPKNVPVLRDEVVREELVAEYEVELPTTAGRSGYRFAG